MERPLALFDTSTGPTPSTLQVVAACDEVALVTTPQPTAIADTYAMAKILWKERPGLDIALLVNQVTSEEQASDVYDKINLVTKRFLNRRLPLFGTVPADPVVDRAMELEKPIYTRYPNSVVARAIGDISRRLLTTTVRLAS